MGRKYCSIFTVSTVCGDRRAANPAACTIRRFRRCFLNDRYKFANASHQDLQAKSKVEATIIKPACSHNEQQRLEDSYGSSQ